MMVSQKSCFVSCVIVKSSSKPYIVVHLPTLYVLSFYDVECNLGIIENAQHYRALMMILQ